MATCEVRVISSCFSCLFVCFPTATPPAPVGWTRGRLPAGMSARGDGESNQPMEPDAIRRYLSEHEVLSLVHQATNRAVVARAPNPLLYMARSLRVDARRRAASAAASSSEDRAGARSSHEPEGSEQQPESRAVDQPLVSIPPKEADRGRSPEARPEPPLEASRAPGAGEGTAVSAAGVQPDDTRPPPPTDDSQPPLPPPPPPLPQLHSATNV